MSTPGVDVEGGEVSVLFVDDYPEYVRAGVEYLETVDEDLEVLPETSPEAALRRLSRESVDCVVCDYEMPEMDGLDLLDAVRSEHPGLPFVLLTGHDVERVASRVPDDGTAVLQKGSGAGTFREVRSRVREVVADRTGFRFDVTG